LKFFICAPPWIFVVRAHMARESVGFCPIVCAKTTKLGPLVPSDRAAFDRQPMQGLRHVPEQ
jgi:hypothetical protein